MTQDHGSETDGDRLGVLTREMRVRVLNCSPTGCLLETDLHLDVGTIASIQVNVDGRELADDVRVVRCQLIAGAGVYHVGAEFLWTGPLERVARRATLRPTPTPR
jgi:hypothetical protein